MIYPKLHICWGGTALLIVFIWNVILPDDMDTDLKMRFISYAVLIGTMIYLGIKNIGRKKRTMSKLSLSAARE